MKPRRGAPVGGPVPAGECVYVGYGQGEGGRGPVAQWAWVESQKEAALRWLRQKALMANAAVHVGTDANVVAQVREADGTRWWVERRALKPQLRRSAQ